MLQLVWIAGGIPRSILSIIFSAWEWAFFIWDMLRHEKHWNNWGVPLVPGCTFSWLDDGWKCMRHRDAAWRRAESELGCKMMQRNIRNEELRDSQWLAMTRNHQFIEFIPRLPVLATVPVLIRATIQQAGCEIHHLRHSETSKTETILTDLSKRSKLVVEKELYRSRNMLKFDEARPGLAAINRYPTTSNPKGAAVPLKTASMRKPMPQPSATRWHVMRFVQASHVVIAKPPRRCTAWLRWWKCIWNEGLEVQQATRPSVVFHQPL